MNHPNDLISPATAGTIPGLFRERVRRTPDTCAYRRYLPEKGDWATTTWGEMTSLAGRWQEAFRREGLVPGDRVAVMLKNCREWVLFDLAALGLGLVTVPLFANDRPDNFVHILRETGARFILIEGAEQWQRIARVADRLGTVERIVALERACELECDLRYAELASWLPDTGGTYTVHESAPTDLATIVYTSGTTGRPKGVMLSHANILGNAYAGLQHVPVRPDDLLLSFLPLSHMLERTAGYYAPMMAGACVAHVRSIDNLAEDLVAVRPTLLIAVPRIFERTHARITAGLEEKPALVRFLFYLTVNIGWRRFVRRQGRDGWSLLYLLWPLLERLVARRVTGRFGGRLRLAISGGAPLAPPIARVFIGLGVDVLQGYGLTETSPVVAVNTLDENLPATVGRPLPGVEVRVAEGGELLVRGPCVMAGYWKNPAATAAVIDRDGWFHTGDQARIDDRGHIVITGRLKEIIVLSTGEKVAPEELEIAIGVHPLFEQVLVVGEGRPYLAALVVLNGREWEKLARRLALAPDADALNGKAVEEALLAEIARRLSRFPGYAQVRRVHATLEPWGVQEGLITATLKLRRAVLLARFAREIEALYEGH
jgi:long-chain acyl-CoA synthetase